MNEFKYSITIVEDISDEQYTQLVNGFKEYFNKKGFKVKSVRRYSSSSEIVFLLDFLRYPVVIPVVVSSIGTSIGYFIIKTFAGEIIKDVYRKIKKINGKKLKYQKKDEILFLTIQEISSKPELLQEYASPNIVAASVKESIRITNGTHCSLKQIKIEYDKPDFEKLEMLIKKEPQYRKLSVDIKYETYYEKSEKNQIDNNKGSSKKA